MCIVLTSVGYQYFDKDLSLPYHFDQKLASSSRGISNLSFEDRPTRFVFGIMTTDDDFDRRHRQAIRDTYLSYYKHDEEHKDRICSLNQLISGEVPAGTCQLAYTFVVGGNKTGAKDFVDTAHTGSLTTMPANRSVFERDVTYLNIKENMNEGKMQSWFKYATSLDIPFDYVAKVDSDTMLYPPRFFSFCEESLPTHPQKQQIYGGTPIDRKSCGKRWWCRRRMEGRTYMAGALYFLSSNLAEHIVSSDFSRHMKLAPREDVAIGNLVYSTSRPVSSVYVKDRHKLWEHGRHLKHPDNYLKRWEEVKEKMLNPSQEKNIVELRENESEESADKASADQATTPDDEYLPSSGELGEKSSPLNMEAESSGNDNFDGTVGEDDDDDELDESFENDGILETFSYTSKPIRFLWGIFTTQEDFTQRELIRKSYLSTYKTSHTPTIICALNDLLQGKLSQPDVCQVAYTFVIGGSNDTNITDLIFNSTPPERPLTVEGPESDVTYLNIHENMNAGKSQSWFAYASHIQRKHGNIDFGYVVKADSDTLVNVPKFLEFAEQTFSPVGRRIFGGIPIYKCGKRRVWGCRQYKGETYMSGEMYFISMDLAHFLTTTSSKTKLILDHEDLTVANLLNEHDLPLQQIPIFRTHWLWEHGPHMKNMQRFSRKWRKLQRRFRETKQWYNTSTVSYGAVSEPGQVSVSEIIEPTQTNESLPVAPLSHVRFVWGIFTTQDNYAQRQLIRKSYLSTFRGSETPNRICRLNDLLKRRLSNPNECRIAYTFVVGGGSNETDVTDLVFNHTAPDRPMTIPGTEGDVTYLNIRENMNGGKSQSWLAYVSYLHKQNNGVDFNYVAKVDSDTLVNVPKFLEFTELTLSPHGHRIYGGVPVYKCGPKKPWPCRQYKGETYMNGELYFMSIDLAHFAVSLVDKPHLILQHEDATVGNLLNEHEMPLQIIPVFQNHWLWEHGKHMKNSRRYARKWRTQKQWLQSRTQWYNVSESYLIEH